jgi:NAD(P)H-dependent FMN reductase
MRVLILHGATGPDPLLDQLAERLRIDFEARKASVETIPLCETRIAWCQGCFECWTHTPGTCKMHDAGRDVARAFVQADVVVLLTPVHFGSYSSSIRKALDRTLGMLLPFFHRIDGETHHAPRYEYPPALGVLAVLDAPDVEGEATVRALARRNAINFSSPAHTVCAVTRVDTPSRQFAACDELVSELCAPPTGRPAISDVERLLPTIVRGGTGETPQRAMLLVGSSKPRGTSTSEALGVELMERLAMRGIEGRTRHVHKHAHEAHGIADLLQELRESDLLLVATPLYVDALPYLLTQVLEAVVSDRRAQPRPRPLAVAMIINCGFPEARHAAVARTIGGLFARDALATWSGALQLGEGGAIAGRALDELGKMSRPLAWAFDEVARALAEGDAIPDSAIRRVQQPLIPQRVYTAAADLGWLWSAAHEGVLTSLWERPDTPASPTTAEPGVGTGAII